MTMEEIYIYSDESEARDLAEIFRRLFDEHYQHLGEDIVIAELSCGIGLILKHLSRLSPQAQIFGIDIDPRVAEIARSSLPSARIDTGDIIQTPWRNESVHLVTSNLIYDYSGRGVFPATYTLGGLAKELDRILIPGGAFIPSSGDYLFCNDADRQPNLKM